MAVPLAQYEKSGIKVVVVGGGFGGLTAAIECHFKGHDVQLIDKCFSQMGDIISLGLYSAPLGFCPAHCVFRASVHSQANPPEMVLKASLKLTESTLKLKYRA